MTKYTNTFNEPLDDWVRNILGKGIGDLFSRCNKNNIHFTILVEFSNVVIADIDMFGAAIDCRIYHKENAALVVDTQGSGIFDQVS